MAAQYWSSVRPGTGRLLFLFTSQVKSVIKHGTNRPCALLSVFCVGIEGLDHLVVLGGGTAAWVDSHWDFNFVFNCFHC